MRLSYMGAFSIGYDPSRLTLIKFNQQIIVGNARSGSGQEVYSELEAGIIRVAVP